MADRAGPPTDLDFLLARAAVARRLVQQGHLTGVQALALTVWPPADALVAERRVPWSTIRNRVYLYLKEAKAA